MSGPGRVEVALGRRTHPVVVGPGLIDRLGHEVPLPLEARRALVVTQQRIVDLGLVDRVEVALTEVGIACERAIVPEGEGAKSIEVVARLWDRAAGMPLSRSDLVVAVGGGVVGDLAGFVAATYNRGVALLQVPTTLLAQVDAAIGGKTGINLAAGKNLVGAFHQPIAVACDTAVLATLPARVHVEGLAEVVKCGLAIDPLILDRLENDPDAARRGDPETIEPLVLRTAAAKAEVVSADERESGRREHLNLGHTIGHALETVTGYGTLLHGEAVAIGTVAALRLGVAAGVTPDTLRQRGETLLTALGLPTIAPACDRTAVWEALTRDKKVRDGVRFVLLEAVGVPTVVRVPDALVDRVLDGLVA